MIFLGTDGKYKLEHEKFDDAFVYKNDIIDCVIERWWVEDRSDPDRIKNGRLTIALTPYCENVDEHRTFLFAKYCCEPVMRTSLDIPTKVYYKIYHRLLRDKKHRGYRKHRKTILFAKRVSYAEQYRKEMEELHRDPEGYFSKELKKLLESFYRE